MNYEVRINKFVYSFDSCSNLLEINFVFVGRWHRVDFTLSIFLTTILAILKLLYFNSINLIALTTTLSTSNQKP